MERRWSRLIDAAPKVSCPACQENASRVTNSRYRGDEDAIIRTRVCLFCGCTFETEETLRRKVTGWAKKNQPIDAPLS